VHKYLRTIGFSKYKRKRELANLVKNLIAEAKESKLIQLDNETNRCEIRRELINGIGIAFVGEVEGTEEFSLEYYYPYVESKQITSYVPCSIQRHAEKEAFSGLMEDYNIGVSLIFYISNSMEYIARLIAKKNKNTYDFEHFNDTKNYKLPTVSSVMLTGLSVEGKIILPVKKTKQQAESAKVTLNNRSILIESAKNGDEEAIESLTIDDMDTYDLISRRLITEDVYSIVESSFIPCGVECDQYAILGEILKLHEVTNPITEEIICIMSICCNNLIFDVAINQKDLIGEPAVGRRFKGKVWLQGIVNFENDKVI